MPSTDVMPGSNYMITWTHKIPKCRLPRILM